MCSIRSDTAVPGSTEAAPVCPMEKQPDAWRLGLLEGKLPFKNGVLRLPPIPLIFCLCFRWVLEGTGEVAGSMSWRLLASLGTAVTELHGGAGGVGTPCPALLQPLGTGLWTLPPAHPTEGRRDGGSPGRHQGGWAGAKVWQCPLVVWKQAETCWVPAGDVCTGACLSSQGREMGLLRAGG